ncbi:hypothetical protein P8C59_008997 [Phyllachora maydis]|uniref:Uncharacterized protein n=1 Tax=Phyllachora maydis TaxID=1825666 RepID=A0AAD9MJ66_9PEZI|nr:hypothetical protein P8C59_008997 [Phyllachora maydis]
MEPFLSPELTMFLLVALVSWIVQAAAGVDPPEELDSLHVHPPPAAVVGAKKDPAEAVAVQAAAGAEERKAVLVVAAARMAAAKPAAVVTKSSSVPAWCRFFGLRARRPPMVHRVGGMED